MIETYWGYDWIVGMPLIVLTVMGHSFALFAVRHRMVTVLARYYSDDTFKLGFGSAMGGIVLFVTVMLAIEAWIWAVLYVAIGAMPTLSRSMLFSLESMTTFGHANLYLTERWQLLGALEALNGVILVGLSTAFIFSVINSAQARQKQNP